MTLILIFCAAAVVVEAVLWLPSFWAKRNVYIVIALCVLTASTMLLLVLRPSLCSLLLAYFSSYRIVNLLRIRENRVQGDYLYHATRRTFCALVLAQIMVLAGISVIASANLGSGGPTFFAAVSLMVSAAVMLNLLRQIKNTSPPELDGTVSDSMLPSLTVAIPARNETVDLELCLQSLITSKYRKLEILVLDDCSQDKRTPEIIRGFAHDGVRFIAGTVPPEHWLAKNYAYHQLAGEANGELLLFCGVDARFEPDSLATLVATMLQKHKTMVSVVPVNIIPLSRGFMSALLQTGRYSWEFLLPRRWMGRPAVLSTCWLISKDMLQAAGGFAAYKQSVIPERHIARKAIQTADSYTFMCAANRIGITSHKSYDEQRATAVRTRYPLLHRRPENVALYSLAVVLLLVSPFEMVLSAVFIHNNVLLILNGFSCIILLFVGFIICNITYGRATWRGLMLWPFIVLSDVGVLNYSLWQYEFHEVIWKGRNVCIPVMHVVPHLPELL